MEINKYLFLSANSWPSLKLKITRPERKHNGATGGTWVGAAMLDSGLRGTLPPPEPGNYGPQARGNNSKIVFDEEPIE